MKMTSERAQEYHDWLRGKVREWQAEYERAVDADVRTGHIHTTRARADCYAYALGRFVELASAEEPTEPLHEMAERLCSGRNCTDCPVDVIGRDCAISGIVLAGADIYAQLAALRRWAAENPTKPAKTYKDDYFEKFPEAIRDSDGYPYASAPWLYGGVSDAKRAEYEATSHAGEWDKPLGYWEA